MMDNMKQSHFGPLEPDEVRGRHTSWDAEGTFLTKRPDLGAAWIVDLKGTSTAERLFMRTLQGTINRAEARLYLVNSDNVQFVEAERFWIEEYERRGWINIGGRLCISEAVAKYGSEVAGFVTATEAEPWTIHAATVIATVQHGVVAPDAVADQLRSAGWRELDDVRGRWPDAVSAYRATVEKYGTALAYPGLAILRHTENLWDFVVQQEIMPVFSRPKHDTWDGVAAIMDAYPGGHVLYGYVSDDTVEEEIAVERASTSGKYLVPTHEVSNLSFHVAVLGKSPLVPLAEKPEVSLPQCDASQVNVALAITDGDNLQVPILQYPQSTYWNTAERGVLPLGWSMGVSLSVLAPGIWEFYRSTIRPNDEIVSIMGIAYVHASTLPEPEKYYRDTFSAMGDAGVHTLWSLDSSLTITDEPLWQVLEGAPGRDALHGVLVGYGPSVDKAFRRDTGTPVLITQNGYSENAARIKERIEAIMALDPAERSPVNFLMATNWNASAQDLYAALKPLADKGVRFLTPAQALACMPDIKGIAKSTVDAQASPGECLPSGPLTQFGSPILSAPTLAEISKPIPIPVAVAVEGTKAIQPGGTIAYTAVLKIDVDGIAHDFLQHRVLPVVEAYGLSQEFAEYAWMKLVASNICVDLPLPQATRGVEVLSVECSGIHAAAEFSDRTLRITLDTFTSDSRAESQSAEAAISFTVAHDGSDAAVKLEIAPESVALGFVLTVGIGDEDGPLVGGVSGAMVGRGAKNRAETAVKQESEKMSAQ
ncbi:MAG TPA: GxGYxYP family putative glycoside hydrolase [Anaerolineae bacterium]|nr:GxGYxYP family putative glycoside hydrolase [Anaerolineae bacterium]HQI86445.1 GxGYxYP family putative glycoside hydrolase [Anaerolineae bacterium]